MISKNYFKTNFYVIFALLILSTMFFIFLNIFFLFKESYANIFIYQLVLKITILGLSLILGSFVLRYTLNSKLKYIFMLQNILVLPIALEIIELVKKEKFSLSEIEGNENYILTSYVTLVIGSIVMLIIDLFSQYSGLRGALSNRVYTWRDSILIVGVVFTSLYGLYSCLVLFSIINLLVFKYQKQKNNYTKALSFCSTLSVVVLLNQGGANNG
ncbi:hypothetical protein SCHIN_v1c02180 [Spiroplasma chinense]|uniref:Transmembrane protein n=1 Tax=Spiroplasma chinense TaxID=216932 RepID=A0A5B9Y3P3_9MOLU|nr:hypothetical protein [Spiroplasma chinense]QEH61415.1 hypothetical protein SCHIN_v1c02180 [Spiroplasma chinense]